MPTPKKKKGLSSANKPAEDVKKNALALGAEVVDPGAPAKQDLNKITSGISKETTADKERTIEGDLDELNEEIDANWKVAFDNAAEWIESAKEDIKFKAGEQWSEEDKQTLASQGRPCLTFNKIKPIINLITGHFIQNSARITVAAEGGEDQKFSNVADKLIDHIDEVASLDFNLGYQFEGGETTGRAFVELYMDYEKDPIFGELKSIYHGKPGIIYPDPRGSSYDLNEDRQFLFKLVKKTKSELKTLYPEKAKEIDEISADTEDPSVAGTGGKEGGPNNYGIDPLRSKTGTKKTASVDMEKTTLRQFHVKEYWRFKYVDKTFVYYVDTGDMVKYETKEEADADVVERKQKFITSGGAEADWKALVRPRKVKEMHVVIRCGGVILADGKSPLEPYYTGFPFFQFIADWTPEAESDNLAMQGMVRCLKDPQREKNKARSQFLHIINTAANSGWIIDEDSMTDNKKQDLKKFGSTPGIIVQKKNGTQVQRIEPVPAPLAQQVREKAANDDFKEVSGVNADLLAVDSSANPSGKAIALRIRQAITILEPHFRNFRRTKKLIGTAIMKIVPTMFDIAKIKKVLGVNFMQQNGIDDTFLKSFLIMIEDLKYNVRIAEQGDTKTLREETFEDIMNMVQNGMQIPFDVIVEFMNIPNKQEMIGRIKAFQDQQAQAANALAAAKGGKGAQGAPAA